MNSELPTLTKKKLNNEVATVIHSELEKLEQRYGKLTLKDRNIFDRAFEAGIKFSIDMHTKYAGE